MVKSKLFLIGIRWWFILLIIFGGLIIYWVKKNRRLTITLDGGAG